MTGSRAFFTLESSPQTTSRLISSPTVKKKMTMRMSLMNFSTVMSWGKLMVNVSLEMVMERLVSRNS